MLIARHGKKRRRRYKRARSAVHHMKDRQSPAPLPLSFQQRGDSSNDSHSDRFTTRSPHIISNKEVRCSSILDLAVAIPRHFISHADLALSRNVEPAKYHKGLGCHEMAVCGPGEDTVTMAAEAGWRLLKQSPKRVENIGLCIVATESSVDGAKPISIYIHELLALPSSCRVFEVKHACYGGTAALQMAAAWTTKHPKKKALVITTDIARYALGSAGEPTQGAGAVAMLIGHATPDESLLQLSEESGVYAQQVYDFWRPNYQNWAQVKGKYSMNCYLKGLRAAYRDYHQQVGKESEPDYMLFHVPFPKMAKKGHDCLSELQGLTEEAKKRDYEARVTPSLWANQRIGNIYTGSLYLSLAALCEREGWKCKGKKVGIFSYGSGSCSEYFTGSFGNGTYHSHIRELLSQRKQVSTEEYEQLANQAQKLEANHSYNPDIPTQNQPFTFLGIRDHERIYRKN